MKIVPKFAGGGGFESLFTLYTPSQATQSTRLLALKLPTSSKSSSSSEDSEKGKLTRGEEARLFKELDGLPNEMRVIMNNYNNAVELAKLGGKDLDDLTSSYIRTLYQIRVAILNKKLYESAMKNAETNGSLAEPAIALDGKLIVQTSLGDVTKVSLELLHSNPLQYHPLSVALLADLRKTDPSLVNKNDVFNVINNSMGYEAFQKLIKEGIASLGTSEISANSMNPLSLAAKKGLEVLGQLTPELRIAVLSGSIESTVTTKDLLNQIEYLTTYLTTLLPDRAKAWAAYKINSDNKNEATKLLIKMNLASAANSSRTIKTDYDGFYNLNKDVLDIQRQATLDASKEARENAKAAADSKEKMTFLTGLLLGYGGRTEYRTLNLGGLANFNASGTAYGAVADLDGKVVTNANLSDVLSKTGIAGITNTSSIWFGNHLIEGALLNKVAITNGGAFRVVLPIVRSGTVVSPDWDLINAYSPLVDLVNKELGNNATYDLRQALLERKIAAKPELRSLLTISGKLDESKFLPFVVMQGLASDRNFEFKDPENSKYISETKNTADTDYFKTVTDSADFDADDSLIKDHFLWWSYDKLYKSDVFIPINTHNRLAAIIFSGQKIPDSRALQIEGESQRFDTAQKGLWDTNLLGQ